MFCWHIVWNRASWHTYKNLKLSVQKIMWSPLARVFAFDHSNHIALRNYIFIGTPEKLHFTLLIIPHHSPHKKLKKKLLITLKKSHHNHKGCSTLCWLPIANGIWTMKTSKVRHGGQKSTLKKDMARLLCLSWHVSCVFSFYKMMSYEK